MNNGYARNATVKKQIHEFRPGDPVVILDGFENKPRRCKVVKVEAGGIIGETVEGLRFFAPRDDRYIVEDLFNRMMAWEYQT